MAGGREMSGRGERERDEWQGREREGLINGFLKVQTT